MTNTVDIANRALQSIGARTTVTATELVNNSSNEAIQVNVSINTVRDELLRMAPWNCALFYDPLVYITSAPGTPENQTAATPTWVHGTPAPPWAYEYQYPVDCLKALWIVPQFQAGFGGGVPITSAITGAAANYWQGPPVKFKVAVDTFFAIKAATVADQGSGYLGGDTIVLAGTPPGSPPIGAPGKLLVTNTGTGGVLTGVQIIPQLPDPTFAGSVTGSYFIIPTNPVAQGSSSLHGVGATFNVTISEKEPQRVILTNQESAVLAYVKQILDPNVMDPQLINAWIAALSARLAMTLTGDKQLANIKLQEANAWIAEARKNDANEGLTINDITPDWIRARGIAQSDWAWTPNQQFDWGPMYTPY